MTDAALARSLSLPAAEALDQVRRQLHALDALTGHGLAVSGAIAEQASGERSEPVVFGDLSLAYARVARAVQQAVLLQQRLIKDLSAGLDTLVARADAENDDTPLTPEDDRKDRVARIVQRVAAERCEGADALEDLTLEACDRLDDDDLYGDLMERPLSEIVARLCRDLGLAPDWSELSQELWARREMADDEVGEPLRAPTSPIAEAMGRGEPPAGHGVKPGEEQVVEGESLRLHDSSFATSDSS